MAPIIFTNKIDEGLLWFNLVSGGFVGVIFIRTNGKIKEIMCQKETGKDLFRFPGGGIDKEDGSLVGLKYQNEFLMIAKNTAIREAKEETGFEINASRLKLIGISKGENEKDEKGGQVHARIFFSYEFLEGEKTPEGFYNSIEDGKPVSYEYRWASIKDGRVDLEGRCVKLSKLHFVALIRFLRAPH